MTEPVPDSDDELIFEHKGLVQTIYLNRPQALNALTLGMVRQLLPQLKEWRTDNSVGVILLKGSGNKAFCSGGDLRSIYTSKQEGGNYGMHFFYDEFTLNYVIGTYPKPLISILNGITFGGAAGLTVIGRYCVCTEKAVFCMPECAIGLFPDVGSGYFLAGLPHNLGLFLGLTGYRVKGADIVKIGLGSHFIDASLLPNLESALENLSNPSCDEVTALLKDFQSKSEYGDSKTYSFQHHLEEIEYCFGGDSVEEILSRLEAGSEWAKQQVSYINKMSPTSLKITFHLLRGSAGRSLADSLTLEYRLTQRCVADHDFMEGIRSVIVDKDQNPIWKPASLKEVTQEQVDYYFTPLESGKELYCLETSL